MTTHAIPKLAPELDMASLTRYLLAWRLLTSQPHILFQKNGMIIAFSWA